MKNADVSCYKRLINRWIIINFWLIKYIKRLLIKRIISPLHMLKISMTSKLKILLQANLMFLQIGPRSVGIKNMALT